MDLEKINAKYEELKNDLAEANKSIDEMEKDVNGLTRSIEQLKGAAANLEEKAEKALTNDEKSRLLNEAKDKRKKADDCQKEINKKEAKLEVKREKTVELKKEIDAKIAEVMKDPEVKQQLEKALEIRKTRAYEKIKPLVEERDKKQKEKEEFTGRKDRLGKISEAIKKNPELKKQLEEVLECKKEEADLKKELGAGIIDKTRKQQIQSRLYELNEDYRKIVPKLVEEMKKANLTITSLDIDGIVLNGIALEKDGSLNLESTLNLYDKKLSKDIKSREQDVNKLNKRIEPYKDIIEKNKKEEVDKSKDTEKTETGDSDKGDKSKDDSGEKDESEDKPKWWQFRKRFNAWREARKEEKERKALPERKDETEETEKNKQKGSRDNFMKNLIVKDAYDQMARQQGIETRTKAKKDEGR